MIRGLFRLATPPHATPRQLTHFDLGLGIQRDSERLGILYTLGMDFLEVVEDRVGFGDLFLGLVLRTRRKR